MRARNIYVKKKTHEGTYCLDWNLTMHVPCIINLGNVSRGFFAVLLAAISFTGT